MTEERYVILDGWLVGVRKEPVPGTGDVLVPDSIVMHWTAGGTVDGAVQWWRDPESDKASAHVVIGRDGEVCQCVPFNRQANHAGWSRWEERQQYNQFSVGIEHVNWGPLEPEGKEYRTWTNKTLKQAAQHGTLFYQPYTPEQLAASEAVCRALFATYRIKHLLGHDEIAPKRKQDPGPLFPLNEFRRKFSLDTIGDRR